MAIDVERLMLPRASGARSSRRNAATATAPAGRPPGRGRARFAPCGPAGVGRLLSTQGHASLPAHGKANAGSAHRCARRDPRGSVAEALAEKSTAGLLTPEEQREYAEIVRLNESLSLLRLQAEDLWTMRAAS